jgi:hypothetical protein
MTGAQADALAENVRLGGSLLLALGQTPGLAAFRLSKALPTIAWTTATPIDGRYGPLGDFSLGTADAEMFGAFATDGLRLPHGWDVRPVAAVERGQGRYERYAQQTPYLHQPQIPGDRFWTRSLLNRDWKVRLAADDVYGTPLLVTGRYGAGRVAVLGAPIGAPDSWPDASARQFWQGVLRWLTGAKGGPLTSSNSPSAATAGLRVEPAGQGRARIVVTNSESSALHGELVLRAQTWEGALLTGGPALAQPRISVPPQGEQGVEFALPLPDPTGYQALDYHSAVQLRVGLLSADGTSLVTELETRIDPARNEAEH